MTLWSNCCTLFCLLSRKGSLLGALERLDFVHCLELLKSLVSSPETLTQWKAVAEVALSEQTMSQKELREEALSTAIECYKILGHKARVQYLEQTVHLAHSLEEGYCSDQVLVKVLMLNQQWKKAEDLLMKNRKVESVLKMYRSVEKWTDMIRFE